MSNIFDEAIEVLETSKSITGFSCDYPEAIKALELGKLYKEAYILFMDIEYLETGGDEKQLTMTWDEIDKRYDKVTNQINKLESELE